MPSNCHIKISVIVPVYNVDAYLAECIDSLLAQDLSVAWEIILVDDCSSDHSLALCQQYQSKHPELIRVLRHSHNQGVSAARNTGLAEIRGTHFTFVDSDDRLPPQALSCLLQAAEHYNADIVKGNNLIFSERNLSAASYNAPHLQIIKGDAILSCFYHHQRVRGHTWGKLFRSDRLGQVRSTPGIAMAEDTLYCAEIFSLAQTLVLIPDLVYHYRSRPSSAKGRKYSSGVYKDWLNAIERAGSFATSQQQQNAFISLQILTLLQLAKELKRLKSQLLAEPVRQLAHYTRNWIKPNSLWQLSCKGRAKDAWRLLQLGRILDALLQQINSQDT